MYTGNEQMDVQLHFNREQGQKTNVQAIVTLKGPLDPELRDKLLGIARKCPMHRTLSEGVDITVVGHAG